MGVARPASASCGASPASHRSAGPEPAVFALLAEVSADGRADAARLPSAADLEDEPLSAAWRIVPGTPSPAASPAALPAAVVPAAVVPAAALPAPALPAPALPAAALPAAASPAPALPAAASAALPAAALPVPRPSTPPPRTSPPPRRLPPPGSPPGARPPVAAAAVPQGELSPLEQIGPQPGDSDACERLSPASAQLSPAHAARGALPAARSDLPAEPPIEPPIAVAPSKSAATVELPGRTASGRSAFRRSASSQKADGPPPSSQPAPQAKPRRSFWSLLRRKKPAKAGQGRDAP